MVARLCANIHDVLVIQQMPEKLMYIDEAYSIIAEIYQTEMCKWHTFFISYTLATMNWFQLTLDWASEPLDPHGMYTKQQTILDFCQFQET